MDNLAVKVENVCCNNIILVNKYPSSHKLASRVNIMVLILSQLTPSYGYCSQGVLREDDYKWRFLGCKLRVERISAALSLVASVVNVNRSQLKKLIVSLRLIKYFNPRLPATKIFYQCKSDFNWHYWTDHITQVTAACGCGYIKSTLAAPAPQPFISSVEDKT